jgi:uncharacterized protein with PIN domain
MIASGTHCCLKCSGAVNREHHTVAQHDDRVDEFLYCEFCGRGWETSTYEDGEIYVLTYIARTEPMQFHKFLQRLEDALAA